MMLGEAILLTFYSFRVEKIALLINKRITLDKAIQGKFPDAKSGLFQGIILL